jgi:hypothetical protein
MTGVIPKSPKASEEPTEDLTRTNEQDDGSDICKPKSPKASEEPTEDLARTSEQDDGSEVCG